MSPEASVFETAVWDEGYRLWPGNRSKLIGPQGKQTPDLGLVSPVLLPAGRAVLRGGHFSTEALVFGRDPEGIYFPFCPSDGCWVGCGRRDAWPGALFAEHRVHIVPTGQNACAAQGLCVCHGVVSRHTFSMGLSESPSCLASSHSAPRASPSAVQEGSCTSRLDARPQAPEDKGVVAPQPVLRGGLVPHAGRPAARGTFPARTLSFPLWLHGWPAAPSPLAGALQRGDSMLPVFSVLRC